MTSFLQGQNTRWGEWEWETREHLAWLNFFSWRANDKDGRHGGNARRFDASLLLSVMPVSRVPCRGPERAVLLRIKYSGKSGGGSCTMLSCVLLFQRSTDGKGTTWCNYVPRLASQEAP
jgi:hypothetical protein